jgi:hypothetical protein
VSVANFSFLEVLLGECGFVRVQKVFNFREGLTGLVHNSVQ